MDKHGTVSVFKKLYILFGVTILMVYFSTIAISVSYASQRRSAEVASMHNAVLYNVSDLEQQLDIIYNQEQSMVSDTRILSLANDLTMAEYDRSQIMRGLIVSMVNMQSMNTSIGNVTVMFPKLSVELSSADNYRKKQYTPRERKSGTTSRSLVCEDGRIQMELMYPLTYVSVENYVPDFGICITLSEDYLQGILEYFSSSEQSGAFFVMDYGSELLLASGREEESERLKESWYGAWTGQGSSASFQDTIRYGKTSYLLMSESLPKYGITLVVYRDGAGIDQSMLEGLLAMGLVLLVISILFLYTLHQTINDVHKPLKKLMTAFGEVQDGNIDVRIFHKVQDEFQYIYTSFNKTIERIQLLLENVKEQGRLLQNAELIQLQSQINPHFLYNSFYLIRIMAKNESYEQIDKFVTSLAKYYRFLNKEVDLNIELSKEEEHMENYMNIQQMRFGDKIMVTKEPMPVCARSYLVPKLILQPIVENAYNYGMKDVIQGGRISVSYRVEDSTLFIMIEDSGNGGSQENLEQMREHIKDYKGYAAGHALSNIDRRLKLAYGDDSGILLEHSELGGLKVILQFDMNIRI